jgi:hypothetical protein
VYRVRDAAPFAHLAARLHVEKSETEAFSRMASDDFDWRRDAVVEALPEEWGGAPAASETDGSSAEVVARQDEVIELRVAAASERLLVVNDAAYPGWEATIDAEPTAIVRTNGLVRGVRIPPGEHRVAFRFRPSGFRWTCVLAAIAALAVLGISRAPVRARAVYRVHEEARRDSSSKSHANA